MRIGRRKEELQEFTQEARSKGLVVGFVPTMGALHNGHLSLINCAKNLCDVVICSIFVNPTQFNNPLDLEKYPRTEESDFSLLEGVDCDFVFAPTVEEVYDQNISSDYFDLGFLENTLEGEHRPNHFQGVCTIVDRFFTLANPHKAFFGEKDYQQVAIIKKMVALKQHAIEIITVPTEREVSGLAMSSRNVRLSAERRKEAAILYRQMNFIKENKGAQSVVDLKEKSIETINAREGFDVEYLEIVDENALSPIVNWAETTQPRVFLAVVVDDVRLIDNLSLI